MKRIQITRRKLRNTKLCCQVYASRGLRCPECNPPRVTVREQHKD